MIELTDERKNLDLAKLKKIQVSEIPVSGNVLKGFTFYQRLEYVMQKKYFVLIHILHKQGNIKGTVLKIDTSKCTVTILSNKNRIYTVKMNQITRLMWKKYEIDCGGFRNSKKEVWKKQLNLEGETS